MKRSTVKSVKLEPASRMEQIYLAALQRWNGQTPPTMTAFAENCRLWPPLHTPTAKLKRRGWPSVSAVRSALLSLEAKGYVRRNKQGRFQVI